MREHLVTETLLATGDDTEVTAKLMLLRELIPASIERDFIVASELEKELETAGWLDAAQLEANPPQLLPTTHSASTRVLQFAIATFPGPINKLVRASHPRTCSCARYIREESKPPPPPPKYIC